MATNNENEMMIEVPVVRGKNGIDIKATLVNAERVTREYAAQDEKATKAVVETTSRILGDERHKNVRSLTAGVLSKMVLSAMGEIPTDKLCQETEERVKAFLKGQPDKFLHIERGRNSGFHFIDRYTKEELAKLYPKKDDAAAK